MVLFSIKGSCFRPFQILIFLVSSTRPPNKEICYMNEDIQSMHRTTYHCSMLSDQTDHIASGSLLLSTIPAKIWYRVLRGSCLH